MKSSLHQMDLQDWELLPDDDGFLEIHDDDGGNKIYSRKNHHHSNSVFHTNYFMPPPQETTTKLPIPIHLQPTVLEEEDYSPEHQVVKKESVKIPVESFEMGADQQDPAVSQVFFKKMNETEFVDIKVESPRSSNITCSRGIMIEGSGGGAFQFEEKVVVDPCNDDSQIDINTDEGGLNIWKWSLSGICSFGVAVCIILLSTHHNKNQKQLQFQIYTSDKRMKQVVHRANKLKEAISAARGAAITRARITVGGYYDASL